MSGVEIVIIVLQGLTLLTGFLSPLVLAGAYFIKNIQHSKCCNGTSEIEMRDIPIKNETEINQTNQIDLNELLTLLKKQDKA